MTDQHVVSPQVKVRPLATPEEVEWFFHLAARTFRSGDDSESETRAAGWQRYVVEIPGFDPRGIRGAFSGSTQVGGYIMYERLLCVGAARLRTGCIGAVVTHPDYRKQGIATTLMRDAIAYARERRYALLLLQGIPNFYHRFDFIDVIDNAEHAVERAEILAQPPGTYQVRPATLDDADTLLALYRHHYGPYTGSFARSLAEQQHRLRFQPPDNPPLLAIRPDGRPCGYLMLPWGAERARAAEVAADDWPAALALLQYQARLVEGGTGPLPEPPAGITWPLPPDSPTFYLLADRFQVRSRAHYRPDTDWMARAVHLPELFQALLPRWQERRQRCDAWSGSLNLTIGDESRVLVLEPAGGTRLEEQPHGASHSVRLSPQVFVQLLFGYRPAAWAAAQPGHYVPGELIPLLEALFPLGHAWLAASDSF